MADDNLDREYVEGFGIEYDDDGNQVKQHKMRVMSPLDIQQRLELNQANTSEALHKRAVIATHERNGGGATYTDLFEDTRCMSIHPTLRRSTEIGHRYPIRCTLKPGHYGTHLGPEEQRW